MDKLSDNYYNRKCYLKREQVPTQSVMMKKMGPPLAKVYFKSMHHKLKVLAGLEPPLKGGGNDWFIPPDELLKGRVVMKPTKKSYLNKLGSEGVIYFGELLIEEHRRNMEREKVQALLDNDNNWKHTIDVACREHWDQSSRVAAEKTTERIQHAFREFSKMYATSLTNIETLLFDGAIREIQRIKGEAQEKMENILAERIDYQAKYLYDYYTKKLDNEKEKLKKKFIKKIEKARTIMAMDIHDMKVDKHLIVEKLRHFLQCQNLACQVYVALKENEECRREMELTTLEHKKTVKEIKEQIAIKDFEILLAQEKEKKHKEFNTIWQKKVCQVVKKLQMFVSYCLSSLPEYADFFIDMEKLMLLQLSEVFENPEAESIFEQDQYDFHTPVPRPHPFYLVCDKGYKPKIEQDLCPKHCTSSSSHMPVVVVNKRLIYAACDNFEEFTSKITQFIHGHRGDDIDFVDDHRYELDFPIKYTSREQIKELQLESSLLQIIQKERPNVHHFDLQCCKCNIPYCFCKYTTVKKEDDTSFASDASKIANKDADAICTTSISSKKSVQTAKKSQSRSSIDSGIKIETRSQELVHQREPQIKDYLDFILPLKCKCAKSAKHHLKENLPPYMRLTSKYEQPEFPNYEMCTLDTLRKLVKKAQGTVTPPPSPPEAIPTHRDVATQYSDHHFDELCTCFSDDAVDKMFKDILRGVLQEELDKTKSIVDEISPSYLARSAASFATETAYKLRHVVDDSPQLREIFMKKDCNYD